MIKMMIPIISMVICPITRFITYFMARVFKIKAIEKADVIFKFHPIFWVHSLVIVIIFILEFDLLLSLYFTSSFFNRFSTILYDLLILIQPFLIKLHLIIVINCYTSYLPVPLKSSYVLPCPY